MSKDSKIITWRHGGDVTDFLLLLGLGRADASTVMLPPTVHYSLLLSSLVHFLEHVTIMY